MRKPLKTPRACLPLLLVLAAGCGGVQVRPDPDLPQPLVRPLPARAALVLDAELRGYQHVETRYGSSWTVDLGPGHAKMLESIFKASLGDLQTFGSVEEAGAASGLQAIFRPSIEQYSFATARDTSGGYWAVTIRYRIGVLTPDGQQAESLALTGYGSSRDKGGNTASLTRATQAAMRDAAAKFLVQLPRQGVAAQLRSGQVIQLGAGTAIAVDEIEAVPIEP